MAANEHQRTDQQDVCEPAHHARRPMNAFLIFCKRHRSSVRSGFPNLENRAVTRVLGEWWATLDAEQKLCYTNLAQEYKDAFLNANPDFKWYKLPAPPLRTLNTRPSNKKMQPNFENESEGVDDGNEEVESNHRTDGNKIQSGKLADESQIGGLSLLITPPKTQVGPEEDVLDVSAESVISKPPKKRYSEPIIMKKDVRANLFGDKVEKESNNNYQLNMDEMNSSETSNDFELSRINFRSERTCKGLRYQKFLAEQMRSLMLPLQNKRKKIRLNSDSKLHEKEEHSDILIQEKCESDLEHLVESAEGKVEASKPEETKTESIENLIDCGSWLKRKRFKAEDFNLEKKIEALPSLSLEEFQLKKKQQRSKKTKFVQKSHKNRAHDTKKAAATKNDLGCNDEEERMLVGSKKRKARKQNITRNAALATSGEPSSAKGHNDNKSWCPTSELNALECLATVAANRTKLTKL